MSEGPTTSYAFSRRHRRRRSAPDRRARRRRAAPLRSLPRAGDRVLQARARRTLHVERRRVRLAVLRDRSGNRVDAHVRRHDHRHRLRGRIDQARFEPVADRQHHAPRARRRPGRELDLDRIGLVRSERHRVVAVQHVAAQPVTTQRKRVGLVRSRPNPMDSCYGVRRSTSLAACAPRTLGRCPFAQALPPLYTGPPISDSRADPRLARPTPMRSRSSTDPTSSAHPNP